MYTKSVLSDNLAERLLQLQDPFVFLEHCVFTQDEVDADRPVKPAPVERPYIWTVTKIWQNESKILVDKSRRMWISWIMLALHLHLAFTNTNRRVGIVSKKFEDACAHLKSMRFIYDHIPEQIWPKDLRPKLTEREGYIFFNEIESQIHALASGPDQARQYGFSALFFDELDFWPEAESTYGAAKPTLQGGGKLSIVTTHNWQLVGQEESFYRRLLQDEL